MRIMRYHELRTIEPSLSISRSQFQSGFELNLPYWQGEIIGIIGSRESSRVLVQRIAQEAKTVQPQTIGDKAGTAPFYSPEAIKLLLVPFQSIADTIYQAVRTIKTELSPVEKLQRAEQYLTAAGLQPFRDLSPLQVPDVVNKQARLALNFIASDVLVLDNLFTDLEPADKALLHTALLNLKYSETRPKTVFLTTQHVEDAIFMTDRLLVLTPKSPGVIGEVVAVWFPRPRDRQSLTSSPACKAIRKRLKFLLTDAFAIEDLLSIG